MTRRIERLLLSLIMPTKRRIIMTGPRERLYIGKPVKMRFDSRSKSVVRVGKADAREK